MIHDDYTRPGVEKWWIGNSDTDPLDAPHENREASPESEICACSDPGYTHSPRIHESEIHIIKDGDGGLTSCCRRTPFELPRTDRLATDPNLVTCKSELLTQAYEEEEKHFNAGDAGLIEYAEKAEQKNVG